MDAELDRQADPPDLAAAAEAKLPHAAEHLAANDSMAHLVPYYEWVFDLARGQLGRCLLDAGCGIGNFVEVARRRVDRVLAVDLAPDNVARLHERFGDSEEVEVLQVDLDEQRGLLASRGVDSIVCLDVLEHIEDDGALLRTFFDIAPSGGVLFVKVPALQWLYGSVDVASDHHRRYHRKDLVAKVRAAGWTVERSRYMNFAGVLPYWLKSRVLRKDQPLSTTYNPKQLRWIARSMRLFRWIDRLTGPPLGQSLVLLARKPATSPS